MRTMREQDAVEPFYRVGVGGDVEAVLSYVKDGYLLLQLRLVPKTQFRYKLPYRRDVPASLLVSGSPYSRKTTVTDRQYFASPTEFVASEYESQYVIPYHAAVFVEPRLENTKPSEWTTISMNYALMRELLATYFTHEYHLLPVFQKDYFLEDIANAKLSVLSLYCIVLLHEYFESFQLLGTRDLAHRFLAEAKRIWETQAIDGRNQNVASTQAAMIINIVYSLCALDKLGHVYDLQGIAIAQNLRLFDGSAHIKSERLRNARDFTTEICKSYSLSQTVSPSYYGHVFKAVSDFRVILNGLERDINFLMRQYYIRHGFGDTDVYLTSPLSKLGFMYFQSINGQMSQQERDYIRSTLLLVLKKLRDQGRNHGIARTVYLVLRNQLRSE
ncbi:hypothetical protein B0J11DRAFT_604110 [Dendryphion nanum]|uniref:Uncharacterized protein n=1 Tax=Dendryphion nanum TaxID=256645 RepID=A0A9P9IRP0_9PLEO|nr:hypothetical protein B0J11DRAFT_604110 [Dendryphion nanum]